jgi:hypothetical protein
MDAGSPSVPQSHVMSWAVIVQNLQDFEGFDVETTQKLLSSHIMYPFDADLALRLAKSAGLKSATLAGSRTPNPYGPDEVCDISVHGFVNATDFVSAMTQLVSRPATPDTASASDLPSGESTGTGIGSGDE